MPYVEPDRKAPETPSKVEQINDFSGGLNTTINGSLLNKSEAQKAINVSFEQKGTIVPLKGRVKRYPAPFHTAPTTGLGMLFKQDGTSHLVMASDDRLYSDAPRMSYRYTEKPDWEKGTTNQYASLGRTEGSVVVDAGTLGILTDGLAITGFSPFSSTAGTTYGWKFNLSRPMKAFKLRWVPLIAGTEYTLTLWEGWVDEGQTLNRRMMTFKKTPLPTEINTLQTIELTEDMLNNVTLLAGKDYVLSIHCPLANGVARYLVSGTPVKPDYVTYAGSFSIAGDLYPTTVTTTTATFYGLSLMLEYLHHEETVKDKTRFDAGTYTNLEYDDLNVGVVTHASPSLACNTLTKPLEGVLFNDFSIDSGVLNFLKTTTTNSNNKTGLLYPYCSNFRITAFPTATSFASNTELTNAQYLTIKDTGTATSFATGTTASQFSGLKMTYYMPLTVYDRDKLTKLSFTMSIAPIDATTKILVYALPAGGTELGVANTQVLVATYDPNVYRPYTLEITADPKRFVDPVTGAINLYITTDVTDKGITISAFKMNDTFVEKTVEELRAALSVGYTVAYGDGHSVAKTLSYMTGDNSLAMYDKDRTTITIGAQSDAYSKAILPVLTIVTMSGLRLKRKALPVRAYVNTPTTVGTMTNLVVVPGTSYTPGAYKVFSKSTTNPTDTAGVLALFSGTPIVYKDWTVPTVGIAFRSTASTISGTTCYLASTVDMANSRAWEYNGWITPPTTGSYTFTTANDDNALVYVNGILASYYHGSNFTANSTFEAITQPTRTAVNLTAGVPVPIRLLVCDGTGDFGLALGWKKPGDSVYSVIPGQYYTNPSYNSYVQLSRQGVDLTINADLSLGTFTQTEKLDNGVNLAVESINTTTIIETTDADFATGTVDNSLRSFDNALTLKESDQVLVQVTKEELFNATPPQAFFTMTGNWYITGGIWRNNAIGHSQSTEGFLTFTIPATAADISMSFNYGVSSESGYDFVAFYLNNTQITTQISGGASNQIHTRSLTTGTHVLKGRYWKDGSATSGSDCGWIETLTITYNDVSGNLYTNGVRVSPPIALPPEVNNSSITWNEYIDPLDTSKVSSVKIEVGVSDSNLQPPLEAYVTVDQGKVNAWSYDYPTSITAVTSETQLNDVTGGASSTLRTAYSYDIPSQGIVWKQSTDPNPPNATSPPPNFAATAEDYIGWRAEGYIYAPTDGTYSFCLNSDDYSNMYVNNTKVADCVKAGGTGRGAFASYELAVSDATNPTIVTPIVLTTGWHSFRVRFQQGGGGYGLAVGWKKPGDSLYSDIPKNNYCRELTLSGDSWVVATKGEAIAPLIGDLSNKYLWIRQTLNTTNITYIPKLLDLSISITAKDYYSSGTWESPVYDVSAVGTSEYHKALASITNSLPSGTGMSVQYATSSDGVTFSGWNDFIDGEMVYSPYFKLKATLATSNTKVSPTLSAVSADYTSGYYPVGYWTSPIIQPDLADYTTEDVWYMVNTLATGTSCEFEMRTSTDNITWTEWTQITDQEELLSDNYVQYRIKLIANTDLTETPTHSKSYIGYAPDFEPAGSWESPVYDLSDYDPATIELLLHSVFVDGAATTPVTTITVWVKTSYNGDAWSDWQKLDIWNKDFKYSDIAMNPFIRLKVDYASTSPKQTPYLEGLTFRENEDLKVAIWTSPAIDVSLAKSLDSGKLIASYLNGGGVLSLMTRSSPNGVDGWSPWTNVDASYTLTSPPNNFVQAKALFTGYQSKLDELVLSMDGNASVKLIGSGLSLGTDFSFTTLRDKLIIANGKDPLKKWNGITDTIEDIPDAPTLKYIISHHNRVWGVDAENQSRVRYSNILDPEKWDAFDFIDFNPEDGDYITAIMKYGQNLLISKQRSMALLTGNKTSNYAVSWLESEQGCSSHKAMCQADKYVAYVAQDGIRFSDLANSIVSTERVVPDWDKINKRRLSQAAVVYWRNKLFVALPTDESLVNNVVWVYDFLRNSWSFREGWSVSTWLKFNQYGEDILLAGSSVTGQLHQVDVTEYDDDVPVTYTWRSKDFHFGAPQRYKLFRNIFLDISGTSDTTTLEVDLIVDGTVTGTYTTEIPAGAGDKHTRRILPPLYGAVLGSTISLEVRGRCGIQGITIEYVPRGAIPGGDL